MQDNEIDSLVQQAAALVLQNDLWLLSNDTSEQSISHKIAFYLQPLFNDYNVDCEYNGDFDKQNNKKSISVLKMDLEQIGLLRSKEANDLEKEFTERAVFPDIIVHRRGTNNDNLCIVEVKKSTSKVSYDYDYIKLRSYTSSNNDNTLKYQLGFLLKQLSTEKRQVSTLFFLKTDKELNNLVENHLIYFVCKKVLSFTAKAKLAPSIGINPLGF